jgi:hypothetical protein
VWSLIDRVFFQTGIKTIQNSMRNECIQIKFDLIFSHFSEVDVIGFYMLIKSVCSSKPLLIEGPDVDLDYDGLMMAQ